MELEMLKSKVLEIMLDLGFSTQQTEKLSNIELGFLRKDATQRHGVTRFKPGINLKGELGPEHIRKVDIHRQLLLPEWIDYGEYVLFHEYCHCLGNPDHGRNFRSLDNLWNNNQSKSKGRKFTDYLRKRNASWIWSCNSCGQEHPRRKRANGRYKCRKCDSILVDRLPA